MPFIQVGGWRGGERAVGPVFAEIDEDDVEKVSEYRWSPNTKSSPHTTYAFSRTNRGNKSLLLHRFIMGLGDFDEDKRVINHIDGNGLNNKKSNLEICDIMYNSQSSRRHHGSHNVGCVYYDTSMNRVKRWKANFTINKVKYQKRFLTEQEGKDWIQTLIPQ